MKLENLIIGIILIIVLVTVGMAMFSDYLNIKEYEIIVKDKYVKRKDEDDTYMVVDTGNNTYKIEDAFLRFKFNSSDLYNKLEINKKYKIKTSGFRIRFLSEYPNINKIEELEEK